MDSLFGLALRKKQFVTSVLSEVARRHGYEQVEVPLVERATSFSERVVGRSPWPEWDQRGCFYLTVPDYTGSYDTTPTVTDALLIPEGTVSVTRWLGGVLNDCPDLVFPLKVHYATACFRNELVETLGEHKRRQFTQFGLEALGASFDNADVEAMYLLAVSLRELGVAGQAIRVRLGDVAVFNRLVELSGLDEVSAIRMKEALDAIAECKAGKDPGRRQELEKDVIGVLDAAGVAEPWRGVWTDLARQDDAMSVVDVVRDDEVRQRLARLRVLRETLATMGVEVALDPCVVRSHEYYTAAAFEIDIVTETETFVEVGGGGRYDRLVGHFVSNGQVEAVPATGFAFGVERLVSVVDMLGLLGSDRTGARSVSLSPCSADMLMVDSPTADGYRHAARAAADAHVGGRAVDIYLGEPDRWRVYAAARGITEIQTLSVGEDSNR